MKPSPSNSIKPLLRGLFLYLRQQNIDVDIKECLAFLRESGIEAGSTEEIFNAYVEACQPLRALDKFVVAKATNQIVYRRHNFVTEVLQEKNIPHQTIGELVVVWGNEDNLY